MPNEYVSYSAAGFTLSLINAGPAIPPGQRGFPPGTMSRTQAVVIGIVILFAMFALVAIFGLLKLVTG